MGNDGLIERLGAEQQELNRTQPQCDAPDWLEDGIAGREWTGGAAPPNLVVAERGDIWRIRLLNGAAQDVLVLSSSNANQDGMARVLPIVDCQLDASCGFAVRLSGTRTSGAALAHMVKTIDFSADERAAVFIERIPAEVLNDAIQRFRALIAI